LPENIERPLIKQEEKRINKKTSGREEERGKRDKAREREIER
jgi:hypothetical protein